MFDIFAFTVGGFGLTTDSYANGGVVLPQGAQTGPVVNVSAEPRQTLLVAEPRPVFQTTNGSQ